MGESIPDRPIWPKWWHWELELSAHLLKRMVDRDFSEVDLRRMLEETSSLRPDIKTGRWIATTLHAGEPWNVILELDDSSELIVAITAYRARS